MTDQDHSEDAASINASAAPPMLERDNRQRNTTTRGARKSNSFSNAAHFRQMPPRLRKVSQAALALAAAIEPLEDVCAKAAAMDTAFQALSKPNTPLAGVPKDAPSLTAPLEEINAFVQSRGEASALKSMHPDQKSLYEAFRDGKYEPPAVSNWDQLAAHVSDPSANQSATRSNDRDRDEDVDAQPALPGRPPRVYASTADLAAMYDTHLTGAHFKAWLRSPDHATSDAIAVLSALARVRKARARFHGRMAAARAFVESSAADVDGAPTGEDDAQDQAHAADGDASADARDEGENGAQSELHSSAQNKFARTSTREARVLNTALTQVREARAELRAKLEAAIASLDAAEECAVNRLQTPGSKPSTNRRSQPQSSNARSRGGPNRSVYNRRGRRPYRPNSRPTPNNDGHREDGSHDGPDHAAATGNAPPAHA